MECVLSIVDLGVELSALVATTGGGVVGSARDPGTGNPRFLTALSFRRKLERIVTEASKSLGDAICLSVNAALWADPDDVRGILAELVPIDRERVRIAPIERCALAGSLGSVDLRRAVVVRADVSSRGWGVGGDGQEASCGGFGEVFGDDGSAYQIGAAGIRAALRAFERRSRNTDLKALLLEHFQVESYLDIARPEHEKPAIDRFAIASFATAVLDAGRRDDEVALEILEQGGRSLANMALSLINELELIDAPFSVLPIGSVGQSKGVLMETFIRTLKTKTAKANLIRQGMGPVAGGVLLAIEQLGLKVRPAMVETLASSLQARP